jgi:hypothetical protein
LSYYVPDWEIPKITRSVRAMATGFAIQCQGRLPQVVHIFMLEDEFDGRMEFLLMKDKEGRFFYETTQPAEMNGVKEYLKIYLE